MHADDATDEPGLMRLAGWLLVGAAVAALAWWQRGPLQAQLRASGVALPTLGTGPVAAPGPARSARKCVGPAGQVVYTDDRCPPGLREQGLDGGTVTVLPAAPAQAATAAAAGASARPLLRQLAPDADGPTLRERMADRLP